MSKTLTLLLLLFLLATTQVLGQTSDPKFNKDWAEMEKRMTRLENKVRNTNLRLTNYRDRIVNARAIAISGIALSVLGTVVIATSNTTNSNAQLGGFMTGVGSAAALVGGIMSLTAIRELDMSNEGLDVVGPDGRYLRE